ncbi:Na+-dependent transporter [Methylocystis sp. B8]|nr:Na+-dependent transporter [Methylocystis sp. B8]
MAHLAHRYFIWIVVASYVFAAAAPNVGVWLRTTRLASVHTGIGDLVASATTMLLAVLLFNAGLFTNVTEARSLIRRPFVVAAGIIGNFLLPLTFIAAASVLLRPWHNPDETQQILTGLAFIAAMPIAGASTAWAQSASGNMALSIGLVLATTLLSPVFTPLVIHGVGMLTTGDYSEDLHELAGGQAVGFLGIWVLAPSLLGVGAGRLVPAILLARFRPFSKLTNYAVIVLLNYANASLSLPGVVGEPDGDFLAIMLTIVLALCLTAFAVGYVCARLGRAGRGETASLMFGLGMNNNGAGLVLASTAMADHASILLPVILYNLTQHFVAALVDRCLFPRESDSV